MEENKPFIDELIGKIIIVQTKVGSPVKDVVLTEGSYKGKLLGFDGSFIKLEYDVTKFVNGKQEITKEVVFIDVAYILTIEEFKDTE